MEFRIADTFTDSLAKLTGEEQKAVKTTAFDLQLNPANPGMQFHKLDGARDQNFWSVRVTKDIRLIVHRHEHSLLLCYVNHHDDAYRWAERRKLETHPKTGAAQFVEVRETVQEIITPKYIEEVRPAPAKPLLFTRLSDDELLSYGVPAEWITDVRQANEDTVLELADHLPGEAAEALLELATGGTPQTYHFAASTIRPFEHPDAQRRFRLMSGAEELEQALEYPWEKWTIFLHPTQQQLVERDYNGPARVAGSAGTGKTVVALHRAAFLARHNRDARVLLTTFSDTLARSLATKLRRLLHHEPRLGDNIEVHSINAIGRRLYELQFGAPQIASDEVVHSLLAEAAKDVEGSRFSQQFLRTEWQDVVDAWQLETWDDYRSVQRLGRKTRLTEQQRAILWTIFERVRSELGGKGLITYAALFARLAAHLGERKNLPFDFAVIDEAQDMTVAQLRFLAALGAGQPNSLFFAGDLGQRIFQDPFSWKALGVDVRGRSHILQINYRTSHQIRTHADHLLDPTLTDVDGITEERNHTISVFNGPSPTILMLSNEGEEEKTVASWLAERLSEGVRPDEIGVFVRSNGELRRAEKAVSDAGLQFKVLDNNVETTIGCVSISTMHLAKGLEFRAVAVMACDDEIIPQQARIETAADDSDLEEVYNTERHLLYVACTRARDHLLVTSVKPASEFLDDLQV